MRIFGYQESLLGKALDVSSERFTQIANNIANVNTPGYVSMDMNFDDELRKRISGKPSIELVSTDPRHIVKQASLARTNILRPQNMVMRNDENSVDIEREIAALIENNIYYSGVAQGLNSKFRLLQSIVQGGRQ